VGKGRKVWKITESPHVINLINRVEKKRRIYIYIYKEEKGNPKAVKSKRKQLDASSQ